MKRRTRVERITTAKAHQFGYSSGEITTLSQGCVVDVERHATTDNDLRECDFGSIRAAAFDAGEDHESVDRALGDLRMDGFVHDEPADYAEAKLPSVHPLAAHISAHRWRHLMYVEEGAFNPRTHPTSRRRREGR